MAAMDQRQRRPVAYDTTLRLTMSQITENLHQQIPNICLDILVIFQYIVLNPVPVHKPYLNQTHDWVKGPPVGPVGHHNKASELGELGVRLKNQPSHKVDL